MRTLATVVGSAWHKNTRADEGHPQTDISCATVLVARHSAYSHTAAALHQGYVFDRPWEVVRSDEKFDSKQTLASSRV